MTRASVDVPRLRSLDRKQPVSGNRDVSIQVKHSRMLNNNPPPPQKNYCAYRYSKKLTIYHCYRNLSQINEDINERK